MGRDGVRNVWDLCVFVVVHFKGFSDLFIFI